MSSDISSVADPDQPDVVIAACQGPYNTYFPDAVRLADGRVAVTYYSSRQHMHTPDSRILLTISTPEGRTWSTPRPIVNVDGMDDRDPSITQLSNGRLLVNWFRRNPEDLTSADAACLVITSDDLGETWSAPVAVDSQLDRPAVTAPPLELADGRLLMPIYGYADRAVERYELRIAVSHDQGASWEADDEITIASTEDPSIGQVEPTLADLGEGQLLMVTRTANHPRNSSYGFWSADAGATWTAPIELDFAGHAPHLLRLEDTTSTVLITWGEYDPADTSSRPVRGRFADGHDRQLAGDTFEIYHNPETRDMSYPSSVQLVDGRCLVTYYDSGRGHIGGTFVTP